MKTILLAVQGVIDSDKPTNAEIEATIEGSANESRGAALALVKALRAAGVNINTARLIFESRAGTHGEDKAFDLLREDTSPQPSPQGGEGETATASTTAPDGPVVVDGPAAN